MIPCSCGCKWYTIFARNSLVYIITGGCCVSKILKADPWSTKEFPIWENYKYDNHRCQCTPGVYVCMYVCFLMLSKTKSINLFLFTASMQSTSWVMVSSIQNCSFHDSSLPTIRGCFTCGLSASDSHVPCTGNLKKNKNKKYQVWNPCIKNRVPLKT